MAARIHQAQRAWFLDIDDEGHREYHVVHLVITDYTTEGPATVAQCPDLPQPGVTWLFDADEDVWAWCRPWMSVRVHMEKEGDPANVYRVEQKFSNKPLAGSRQRCADTRIEDPLLEPPKINGSFVKYTEEATVDRWGLPIVNSAWEQLRGPQVEFDRNRPQVKIEQNVVGSYQAVSLPALMTDTVNDQPLWGAPRRCVKLSDASFERVFYGQCLVYFKRSLTFDINFETFDRLLLDEGTKVLHGQWDKPTNGAWNLININGAVPNPFNPAHFDRYKDRKWENTRCLLNGRGLPAKASVCVNGPFYIAIANTSSGVPGSGWVLVNGNLTPVTWTSAFDYQAGDIVQVPQSPGSPEGPFNYYVSTASGNTNAPGGAGWTQIPGVTDSGFWAGGQTYTAGEVVRPSGNTGVGSILLEKYGESNFLLLGIPLTF